MLKLRVAFVLTLLLSCVLHAAEPRGISTSKPAEGPFVEVDDRFMVSYTETIPGTDISFQMIPVPGGNYLMGSPASEAGRNADEGPQIQVEVDPMWVCKTEVRWIEYRQYMDTYLAFKEFESQGIRKVTNANKVDAVTSPTELYDPSFTFEYGDDDDQPAVTMTQFAAKHYTKWLSKLTQVQYRLPTEAEWEWACRGGTNTAFSFEAKFIDAYAWYAGNSEDGAARVGTKKPNAYGLHDMHGNVAEWTIDAYLKNGYAIFEGRSVKAVEAIKSLDAPDPRVVRGGSWEMDAKDVRSAARLYSVDEDWKLEDPNIPLSPWWFTSDPSRGVGMRVFRSYKPIDERKIVKFWEQDAEDINFDVKARLNEGRGVLGLVDPQLPAAIKALE